MIHQVSALKSRFERSAVGYIGVNVFNVVGIERRRTSHIDCPNGVTISSKPVDEVDAKMPVRTGHCNIHR